MMDVLTGVVENITFQGQNEYVVFRLKTDKGMVVVTVDAEVKMVTENQSVYVPLGAVHRLENPGKVPVVMIEVQTGSYLGEDDIVRYEDVYSRT